MSAAVTATPRGEAADSQASSRSIGGAARLSPEEQAAAERAAQEQADLLVRKVQKLASVLRLAEAVPDLKTLLELKSFANGGAHACYFGELPTSFHLFRSARDTQRGSNTQLGPLETRKKKINDCASVEVWSREAKVSTATDTMIELTVWDVRGLVDLALVAAHSELRHGNSWKGTSGSPPTSLRSRGPESGLVGNARLVAAMQPPAWEHLDQLRTLRDEIRHNRSVNPSERGPPWPGDWKPHKKLTKAMLDGTPTATQPAATEAAPPAVEEDDEAEEDSPLELTQRLLYMSAVKKRASAAWEAAKDVGGRGARGLMTGPLKGGEPEDSGFTNMIQGLTQRSIDALTVADAIGLIRAGPSEKQLKGLRALARLATHGAVEQAHIVQSGGLEIVVKCMVENMSSASLQQAGCVVMINLARQSKPLGHIGPDGHPIAQQPTQGFHMFRNLGRPAGDPGSDPPADPPWLRRCIVDKGGLAAILGCMEAFCVDEPDEDAVGVQHCACAALYNLAFDAGITPDLEERGAIKLIIDAMNEFPTVAMLQESKAAEEAAEKAEAVELERKSKEEEALNSSQTSAKLAEIAAEYGDEDGDAESTDEEDRDSSEFGKMQRAQKKKREEAAAALAQKEQEDAEAAARAEEQAGGRVEIQAYCCAALQNFSAHAAHEKAVRNEGAIGCILVALRCHPNSSIIQLHGISALCNLAPDPSSKRLMAAEGAALYAEAARHFFGPHTKVLNLPTDYALSIARTRLKKVVNFNQHVTDAAAEFRDQQREAGSSVKEGLDTVGTAYTSARKEHSNVIILSERSFEVRFEASFFFQPHFLLHSHSSLIAGGGAGGRSSNIGAHDGAALCKPAFVLRVFPIRSS